MVLLLENNSQESEFSMRFLFPFILFISNCSPLQADDCAQTEAFGLFFGEHRQLAYDIVGEPGNAQRIADTLKTLNQQLSPKEVADYEFTDQVHRVLTTSLIKQNDTKVGESQKQQLFDLALEKAYQFNLSYEK